MSAIQQNGCGDAQARQRRKGQPMPASLHQAIYEAGCWLARQLSAGIAMITGWTGLEAYAPDRSEKHHENSRPS